MYDLIIKNGKIIDGTNTPWFKGGVAIKDDKIAEVGPNVYGKAKAKKVIDAEGKVICPGFIDVHNHSDSSIHKNLEAECCVRQGVTTLVVGNCGMAQAPVTEMNRRTVQNGIDTWQPGVALNWSTFGEYFNELDKLKTTVNLAVLVGHNALRESIVGKSEGLVNDLQLEKMKSILNDALEIGAFGLSVGLEFMPGRGADETELLELHKCVHNYNRIAAWHVRNRDRYFEEAVAEAISIAQKSDVPLQIAHLTAKPGSSPRAWNRCMEKMELARTEGVDVTADMVPDQVGIGRIFAILPQWVFEKGMEETIRLLKDKEIREKLKTQCDRYWFIPTLGQWDRLTLVSTKEFPELIGKNFEEIAKEMGQDPWDCLFDILAEAGDDMDHIQCNGLLFTEGQVLEWLSHELVIISPDMKVYPFGKAFHPNVFNWTAKVLGYYVREVNLMSLEKAIYKMTAFPAARFGLFNRGIIRPGMKADIVVFDPDTVKGNGTYLKPNAYPTGFYHVLNNGTAVLEDGKVTGQRPGILLRA